MRLAAPLYWLGDPRIHALSEQNESERQEEILMRDEKKSAKNIMNFRVSRTRGALDELVHTYSQGWNESNDILSR